MAFKVLGGDLAKRLLGADSALAPRSLWGKSYPIKPKNPKNQSCQIFGPIYSFISLNLIGFSEVHSQKDSLSGLNSKITFCTKESFGQSSVEYFRIPRTYVLHIMGFSYFRFGLELPFPFTACDDLILRFSSKTITFIHLASEILAILVMIKRLTTTTIVLKPNFHSGIENLVSFHSFESLRWLSTLCLLKSLRQVVKVRVLLIGVTILSYLI